MSRENVMQEIITPMRKRWKPKAHADVDASISDYLRLLDGYSIPVLAAAFDSVLLKHKYDTWPSVAVFVEACDGERTSAGAVRHHEERDPRVDVAMKAARWAQNWMNRHDIWENGWFMFLRPIVEEAARQAYREGREPSFTITPEIEATLRGKAQAAREMGFEGGIR